MAAYARELAAATGCPVVNDEPPDRCRLHIHFTDRLWGPSPEAAAARVAALATRHAVTVTLHDLPQPSDGPERHVRRAAAYAQVVAAAQGLVVNSGWEMELLGALGVAPAHATVIPLPVSAPAAAPVPEPRREVGLIGYVYPGKGHAEVIDAAAGLDPPLSVVALGAVASGHAGEARALGARAQRRRVRFRITGYLPQAELMRRARAAAVPVAAHQHVSASASIGTWMTAGRRPLVADSPYAREIDALRPHTITRYAPGELGTAVRRALVKPESTWLAAGVDLRPGPAETAAAYLRWWSESVSW